MFNREIADISGVLQEGSIGHRVYAYAIRRSWIDGATCANDLELTPNLVADAILDLVSLRLLLPAQGSAGHYVAVSPQSASLQLLAPYDEELRARQHEVEQVRQHLQSLVPLYQANGADERSEAGYERVEDLDAVRGILGRLAQECQQEVITSQPGGARNATILEEAARRDSEVLGRGVRMRTLYQHTARFDQPTRTYVEQITGNGAEVRTTGNGFMRAIIYDRRTAVISLPDNPKGAVLIRDPDITHFIVQAFEWAWMTAEPFKPRFDREEIRSISDSLTQTLLRMLVSGHDDKSIARQLGISPRTCQRRISELMQDIDARTRLQAGYLVRQLALIPPPGDPGLAGKTGSDAV